jgi:hypothetical protein
MTSRPNKEDDWSGADSTGQDSSQSDKYRTSATVVGLFTDRDDASKAISDLREAGFTEKEIGIAMQDKKDLEDLSHQTGAPAADGAAKGAVSGGVVGGIIGLLGSLLIPGIGPIVAGGVLGSMLAGAGIGAATGGIIGALIGLGVSKEEAEHFDRGFREGGILVTVGADERAMEARAILRDRGADLGPSYTGGTYSSETATGASSLSGTSQARGGWDDLGRDEDIEDADFEIANSSPSLNEAGSGWQGSERRTRRDLSYSGPERRMSVW